MSKYRPFEEILVEYVWLDANKTKTVTRYKQF